MLQLADCTFGRLDGVPHEAFDCGDADLNGFLRDDAVPHQQQLLAVTYLIRYGSDIVAYFSVLNDKIASEEFPSKSKLRILPFSKRRYKSYPAVKLGRLAVTTRFQNQDLGTQLLDYIKIWFINRNKTGCRFITVDAYDRAVKFYERNGFISLSGQPEDNHTKLMYFDLKPIAEELEALSDAETPDSV